MSFSRSAQILIRIHRIIRILWQEIICTKYFAESEEFVAVELEIFGNCSKYARLAMNWPHAADTTGCGGVCAGADHLRDACMQFLFSPHTHEHQLQLRHCPDSMVRAFYLKLNLMIIITVSGA